MYKILLKAFFINIENVQIRLMGMATEKQTQMKYQPIHSELILY